jgi:hypothetical protein
MAVPALNRAEAAVSRSIIAAVGPAGPIATAAVAAIPPAAAEGVCPGLEPPAEFCRFLALGPLPGGTASRVATRWRPRAVPLPLRPLRQSGPVPAHWPRSVAARSPGSAPGTPVGFSPRRIRKRCLNGEVVTQWAQKVSATAACVLTPCTTDAMYSLEWQRRAASIGAYRELSGHRPAVTPRPVRRDRTCRESGRRCLRPSDRSLPRDRRSDPGTTLRNRHRYPGTKPGLHDRPVRGCQPASPAGQRATATAIWSYFRRH